MYNNDLKIDQIALAISEGTAVKTLKTQYAAELDELGLNFSRNWSYANRGANLANLEAAVRRRESSLYDSTADLESILNVVQDMNVGSWVKHNNEVEEGLGILESNLESYVSEAEDIVSGLPILYSQVQKIGLPARRQEQKSGLPVLHERACYDGLPVLYEEPVELADEFVQPIDIEVLPDSAIEPLEADVIPFPQRYRGPIVEPGKETAAQALALAGTELAWKGGARRPRTDWKRGVAAGIVLAIALAPAIAAGQMADSLLYFGESITTKVEYLASFGSGDSPSPFARASPKPSKSKKHKISWSWAGEDFGTKYAQVEMHTLHKDHDLAEDPMNGQVPIPQKGNSLSVEGIPTGVDSAACPLPDFLIPGPKGTPICGGAKELAQYDRRVALEQAINTNLGVTSEEFPDVTKHLVAINEEDDVERFLDRFLPLDAV